MTVSTPTIKQKKYHFALILPIFINITETLIKLFKENNCSDMIPSIQFKQLNLQFYRESNSYENAIKSAQNDVKKTLETLGFNDLKIMIINHENN